MAEITNQRLDPDNIYHRGQSAKKAADCPRVKPAYAGVFLLKLMMSRTNKNHFKL